MAEKRPGKPEPEAARTVFEPRAPGSAGSAPPGRSGSYGSIPPPSYGSSPPLDPGATSVDFDGGARVAIGSVLNHIYEVRRFIARGGMGAVYEGVNVNTDERVAIKVILPHLAADPKVQALFRKEARTLTRLSHPALAQYRVLAMEPQLGVLYIVTEYVDGVGLDQVIGLIHPSQSELLGLMRRLAEGLRVAHELGAIHRDISPDNILLPQGRLESATIIDFGIAKDLDASHATIVGDGFAGKLGFVSPEQFGDFGREIGPWTDVYSLGLVILSLAAGKAVDMGSTLVEAIDRRRAGPEVTAAPPALRPLLTRMLAADPAKRLRSMDEVLREIAEVEAPRREPPRPRAPPPAAGAPPRPPPARPKTGGGASPWLIGGGVALAAVVALAALVFSHHPKPVTSTAATASAADQTEAGLQQVSCAWIESSQGPDGGPALTGAGAQGWEGAVSQIVPGSDQSKVLTLTAAPCDALQAARGLRQAPAPGQPWVKAGSPAFTPGKHPECGDDPKLAQVLVNANLDADAGQDTALYLLGPKGGVKPLFRGRDNLPGASGSLRTLPSSQPGEATLSVCAGDPGPYGLLAIRGQGPFPAGGDSASLAADLRANATARDWRTQMDWFTVDVAPEAPPTPAPIPVTADPSTSAAPPQSETHGSSGHTGHHGSGEEVASGSGHGKHHGGKETTEAQAAAPKPAPPPASCDFCR